MNDGFDYEGIWINDPHWDPTHRWIMESEHDACVMYGFPENFHQLWEDTKEQFIGFAIGNMLDMIFKGQVPDDDYDDTMPLYDVDMFIIDIKAFPWKSYFKVPCSEDAITEFMCGVMAWCHRDHYYGLTGQVIIFLELNAWCEKYFN